MVVSERPHPVWMRAFFAHGTREQYFGQRLKILVFSLYPGLSCVLRKETRMELWDVYDHCFRKTGKVHERGKPLAPGDYHLVVAVFPINSERQVLIQKRNPDLKLLPGIWAATGGSAVCGEDAWDACKRELMEELGIAATRENSEMVAAFKRIDSYNTVWLVHTDSKAEELVLQTEEVSDAKWVTIAELKAMAKEGTFNYYRYLDWLLDYIKRELPPLSAGGQPAPAV